MSIKRDEIDRLERAVARSLHDHWLAFLIEGIILVILGAAAILVPPLATLSVAIFLGWLFLISGITGLIGTLRMRHAPGFAWSLVSAVLAQERLMSSFPLAADDLAAAEFRKEPIERLIAVIDGHVAAGRYPGCQIALARGGRLVLERAFGAARIAPERKPAKADSLFLLYSNTKVVTATALWVLAERGAFSL